MPEAVVIRPARVEDVSELEAVRQQPGVIAGTLNIPSERLLDRRRIEDLGPNVPESKSRGNAAKRSRVWWAALSKT